MQNKTEVQVTTAAVSKWERGVATPELNLIAEMADLFGVSFDTIVGFEVQNGSVIALVSWSVLFVICLYLLEVITSFSCTSVFLCIYIIPLICE